MSDSMEGRIGRIESDVEHIKDVTTDLRVELRRTDDKMDAGFQAANKKIDDVHHSLRDRIDTLNNKLNSISIWALLLYITLAGGLLTVIARSFKWF